jgi:NAD-dependent deacetylase
MVRPDVVLYGEGLDNNVMDAARLAIESAETIIVAGTSLSVYPAAGLVRFFRGDNLVLINTSATPLDAVADLVIYEKVGEVFKQIMELRSAEIKP